MVWVCVREERQPVKCFTSRLLGCASKYLDGLPMTISDVHSLSMVTVEGRLFSESMIHLGSDCFQVVSSS